MMGYTGFVPSEYSRAGIQGPSHPHRQRAPAPRRGRGRLARTPSAVAEPSHEESATDGGRRVAEIAWKAQERLHRKFTKMTYCRKPAGKVAAAVARELVGFIWAIGVTVERRFQTKTPGRRAAASKSRKREKRNESSGQRPRGPRRRILEPAMRQGFTARTRDSDARVAPDESLS